MQLSTLRKGNAETMPESTPGVNTLSAALFLETLAPGEAQFFRIVKHRATKDWHGVWNTDLEAWLTQHNADEYNIYYAVNGCGKRGPKHDAATALRCIYLDNDNTGSPGQRTALAGFLHIFPPHIAVATSPGKTQLIWLTEQLPLALQPQAGRNAATWFGTDRQVIDAARILRLPGFRNWSRYAGGELKYPDGPLVTCGYAALPLRTEAEIREAFGLGAQDQAGNLLNTVHRVEQSGASSGLPAGFDRGKPQPLRDADPRQSALVSLHGKIPGAADTAATGLIAMPKIWRIDDVIDTLALCDPDAPGDTWRKVAWGLKEASSAAPWAQELFELWSSLALQPWPNAPVEAVWLRGTSRTDWRAIAALASRCTMPLARKQELRKQLDAFKRSNPAELVEIKEVVPKFPDAHNNGELQQSIGNYRTLCALEGIEPRYDRFTKNMLSGGVVIDDSRRFEAMGRAVEYGFQVVKTVFHDYLQSIAHANAFDSAMDWLESMPVWDGVPRLYTCLHRHMGAELTHLTGTIFTLWMCGGVRRILRPGAQFPNILTIHGTQGLGKSAFFKTIAGNADDASLRYNGNMKFDDDARGIEEQTRGCVIVELGELSGLPRRDREHVKTFVSSEVDTARAAYAHDVSRTKRRFILAGTTNFSNLLREKDNRRWWIVPIPKETEREVMQHEVYAEHRQLWAEAIALEATLDTLALPHGLRPALAKVQQGFRAVGVLADDLADVIGFNGQIAKGDLWSYCGYPKGGKARSQHLLDEMTEYMEEHGWKELVTKINGKTTRVWRSIKDEATAVNYTYMDSQTGFKPGGGLCMRKN